MIQEICKDEKFLAQKAEQATPDDIQTATDLLETLEAHKDGCVGMAANMIGVNKRIIAFDNEGTYMVMFNPQIVKQSGGYEAEEGCLSLIGTRKTRRWQSIKVQYQNEKFQTRLKTFTGEEYRELYQRMAAGTVKVERYSDTTAMPQTQNVTVDQPNQ